MKVLAKRCFVTDATISNLENEVSEDPGHKVLMDLAAALGVTLDKIMRAPESSTPGDDLKAMFNVLSPDQQSAILSTVQHLLEQQGKR